MSRIFVDAAEQVLDKQFRVLDKGFVSLVDYLGGDARIVEAARVSVGSKSKGPERDKRLIRYLLRHGHTSPFEQVILTFHARMPIFVARQWVRHRTARLNEISGRYTKLKDDFYVPDVNNVRYQSEMDQQGSSDGTPLLEDSKFVVSEFTQLQSEMYRSYEKVLGRGIARELARVILPLSTYTEWFWQIDLHNLFNFLRLRSSEHAQLEIRAYAEKMGSLAKLVAPIAFEAFEEFDLYGRRLPRAVHNRLVNYLGDKAKRSAEAKSILNELI